jgi:next-to-BRCA1 protein 1
MAAPASLPSHPGPEHLVTVKVLFNDSNRRFKLPLKDLRAQVLPQKLRTLLGVPADVNVILERYSDSAGSYIRLDSDNVAVYKQLHRAAKAKSKLRIKASTVDSSVPAPSDTTASTEQMSQSPPRYSYLETVLSPPIAVASGETQSTASDQITENNGSSFASKFVFPQSKVTEATTEPRYRDFEMDSNTVSFPVISHNTGGGMFCIDCNQCGRSVANEHYHCGICESGDYDLCLQCVKDGISCPGEGHWLIKRTVENGVVTHSNTEKIPPRQPKVQETKPLLPQQAQEFKTKLAEAPIPSPVPAAVPTNASHTDAAIQGEDKAMCNGCCRESDESNLVRCNTCEDYDLCLRCLLRNQHGHHPAHSFSLGSDRNFCLKNLILSRCLPGRQYKHAAICDGCEKNILGTRHKCLSCPDWDYCSDCIIHAAQNHPGHRFAPLYEAIGEQPNRDVEVHFGVFCDGPLCKNKPAQSYITGVRYKCAVCDDVDFCANCEALPTHSHNRSHPLVKFKTPVRTVTVSTFTDDVETALGDQSRAHAPIQPTTYTHNEIETSEKQPIVEQAPVEVEAPKNESLNAIHGAEYHAYFIRDTVADGTKIAPDTSFCQTWTLYNPGPQSWPVGSDVRFVGGDGMWNVDPNHPSSTENLHAAMESNKLVAPVQPGTTAEFSVNLHSPTRPGTAISYWRLKLPDGTPIGHRLWCDIQVQDVASNEPAEVADSVKHEAPVTESAEATGSHMIFPKLEKESPETSTHEAMTNFHPAPTISTASEGDVLEDVESLTLEETDTDAGFLTDEEYDVLDASDQEFLEAKQSLH